MVHRSPPQIDMLLNGSFRLPRRRPSLPMRIAAAAIIVAVLAGTVAVAALALWLVAALIPIAVVAGVIAWVAIRFQLWRTRRSYSGPRDVFRER